MKKLIPLALLALASTASAEHPVTGQTVVLCTGMSNAKDECRDWKQNNATDYFVVNGANSAQTYSLFAHDPQNVVDYFAYIEKMLVRNGLTFADVDIVYNKNITICGRWWTYACDDPLDIRKDEVLFGMIGNSDPATGKVTNGFHADVYQYMPQAVGYHGSRIKEPVKDEDDWCLKAPMDVSYAHRGIIGEAVTTNSQWFMGPDLGSVDYVRADFVSDGCHLTTEGKVKTTAILNDFFLDLQNGGTPPPPPPPEPDPCLEFLCERHPADPLCEPVVVEPPPVIDPPDTLWPEPEVAYRPKLPAVGDYTVPDGMNGVCETPQNLGTLPVVTLQNHESLESAVDRLTARNPLGGTIRIPYGTDLLQCDSIRSVKSNSLSMLALRGIPGPKGELPRFYCRAETKDGTIPRDQMAGAFATYHMNASDTFLIENLEIDGYAKHITGMTQGKYIIRHNFMHHGLNDGMGGSNNTSGVDGYDVQVCGNEFSHSGQGNAIHIAYMHRSYGGAGDKPGLDGTSAWSRLIWVNNVAHDATNSSVLKSIANENIILDNELYGHLETDPAWPMRHSTLLIDISACSLNTVKGNYLHRSKPKPNAYGAATVGIRNRRSIRGCDIPQMWTPDQFEPLEPDAPDKLQWGKPIRVEGPWHTNVYWEALDKKILFPTVIENNTFVAAGDYPYKEIGVMAYGTYPNAQTGLGSPSCWLPTPDSWYERSRVYMKNNTFVGHEPDNHWTVNVPGTNYHGICWWGDADTTPGPGPSSDLIEVQ